MVWGLSSRFGLLLCLLFYGFALDYDLCFVVILFVYLIVVLISFVCADAACLPCDLVMVIDCLGCIGVVCYCLLCLGVMLSLVFSLIVLFCCMLFAVLVA